MWQKENRRLALKPNRRFQGGEILLIQERNYEAPESLNRWALSAPVGFEWFVALRSDPLADATDCLCACLLAGLNDLLGLRLKELNAGAEVDLAD